MESQEFHSILEEVTSNFRNLLDNELTKRWESITIDLSQFAEYEVIWGLVSRQCSFVNEMSYSCLTWNQFFLPIVMRCMVENYINISWILQQPSHRAKMFIKYGLGRETKHLEYLKLKADKSEKDLQFIQQTENWINQQSFTFLNEINVGGWKKEKEFNDVRNTAKEAGEKEYYDIFYDVCSSATHSTWNYIGKHNLKICENPLHKNHRIPIIKDPEIEPKLFLILAGILKDTFGKVDKYYDIKFLEKSSFEYLKHEFDNKFY